MGIKESDKWDNTSIDETEFEVINKILIVHVNGELDHHNSIYVREKADEKIIKEGIKNIIFDFNGTDFMDSSGIGVIMGRYKLIREFNGKIAVVNVKNNIKKILLFSGLNKIITLYSNMKDAIDSFSGGVK